MNWLKDWSDEIYRIMALGDDSTPDEPYDYHFWVSCGLAVKTQLKLIGDTT